MCTFGRFAPLMQAMSSVTIVLKRIDISLLCSGGVSLRILCDYGDVSILGYSSYQAMIAPENCHICFFLVLSVL
jgi:hypothetical protein